MRSVLALVPALLWSAPSEATPDHDPSEHLGAYLVALDGLRRGERSRLAELERLAEHLCAEHARCDTRDVYRFFAALDDAALIQGRADLARFVELRDQVVDAGSQGLEADTSWSELRAELCTSLDEFAQRVEARPDFTPAAAARALHALLQIELFEASTEPEQRAHASARAEEDARRAIELFTRAGQVTPRLEPIWVLGRLARARGEPRQAREAFEELARLALAVGRDEWRERALLGLADLARDAGDVWEIDRLLAELARFRDPATSWPLAREHGRRLLYDDRPAAAASFLLRHAPGEAAWQGEWHALLAAAFLREGDLEAARAQLDGVAEGDEFERLSRATLDLGSGQPQLALERLSPWLDARAAYASDAPLGSFLGRTRALTLAGEALLALGRPGEARVHLAGALARAEEQAQLQREHGGGSVFGEWIGLHAVVAYATACAREGDALEAGRAIEAAQSRRLRGGRGIDGEELRAWAASFEAGLVTYGVGADSTLVVHVDRDGDAWSGEVPYGRRVLQGAVRRLREATLAGDEPHARRLAHEIAGAILPAGLWARVAAGSADDRLLFLLHGPLESLPLSMLTLDGFTPLEQRVLALVLPGLPRGAPSSARVFEQGMQARWTLLGDPRGADGAPRLVEAQRELALLARLYPRATQATGSAFTREAVDAALAGAGPLHLATHLAHAAPCGASALGLELSNGEIFCASRVRERAAPSPLVVLSACETAGGRFLDAEGLHGLTQAFLGGGARNLLSTLWPVDDRAALRFGLAFHEALRAGALPSLALRRARRLLESEGFPLADRAAWRLTGRD